ncbi:MAG: hypothetical protein VB031_09365 [Eubacteriaceae bacterium]|nr:hypothetical protein [Eubacteriaceae bacterium]
MKKIGILIILVFALMIIGVGCGSSKNISNPAEAKAVFDDEGKLPCLMAVSDDTYYVLTSRYGDDAYTFSASDAMDKLNIVYKVENTSIWYLCADGDYAAWVEEYDNHYDYKVYNRNAGKVTTINTIESDENNLQNKQMGIYNGKLYYTISDRSGGKAKIEEYDLAGGGTGTLYQAESTGNGISTLEVKENTLIAYVDSDADTILKIDLESGGRERIEMPEKMDAVYTVSYDTRADKYALYYSAKDSGTEDIGTFCPGDKKIKSLFTMGDESYAYHDTIEIDNGHLYWVTQLNTSGVIMEHYRLTDYDCDKDDVAENDSTFGFTLTDDSVYMMEFSDSINEVKIEKVKRR